MLTFNITIVQLPKIGLKMVQNYKPGVGKLFTVKGKIVTILDIGQYFVTTIIAQK